MNSSGKHSNYNITMVMDMYRKDTCQNQTKFITYDNLLLHKMLQVTTIYKLTCIKYKHIQTYLLLQKWLKMLNSLKLGLINTVSKIWAECNNVTFFTAIFRSSIFLGINHCMIVSPGNTKGGSITVPLTSSLTGLESTVSQLTFFVFICKTD